MGSARSYSAHTKSHPAEAAGIDSFWTTEHHPYAKAIEQMSRFMEEVVPLVS